MNINEKVTIKFNDDFFKEEIKCDFIVTEKQKRIWAIELDLMAQLLRVCKKHNIRIMVFAGTLLGAIRHSGFIPWDDDFDVCILRDDFEKLLKIAPNEFKDPYFLQSALSDRRYFMGYARLRNSLTTAHILKYHSPEYNHGIYIDIYVVDGYVNDKKLLSMQLRKRDIFEKIANTYSKQDYTGNTLSRFVKKIASCILHVTMCKWIKYETVVKWYVDTLSKYNKDSEYVTTVTHERKIVESSIFEKAAFDNIIYMPFENIEVPVPADYDKILRIKYGDYMKFPPKEKRGVWHTGVVDFDPDIEYKDYFKK